MDSDNIRNYRTLNMPLAQPTAGVCPLPLTVVFSDNVPELVSLDALARYYRAKAIELVDAFIKVAPGGLVDAVLVRLLERKVSLFRVPFGD